MNTYTFAYAMLCNIAYTISIMDVLLLICIVVWGVSMVLGIGYLIVSRTEPYFNIIRNSHKRNQYINAHREDERR